MPEMAPEAMEALASSVRRLRTLLEGDLASQLERRLRLSVPRARAGLGEQEARLRARLESWLAERERAHGASSRAGAAFDARALAVSELGASWLHRLVLLRQLEACGISRPTVLTGGWRSKGYLELRSHAPALTDGQGDSGHEGLDVLLRLVFDELSVELPGLYGEHPLDRTISLSPGALRELVTALDAPALATAWHDDTTLGWVYQFWNDPDREAIDRRVGPRGKVSVHEVAAKTQLFTERYMVDWLLQNSLGRVALALSRARGEAGQGMAPPSWPMLVRGAAALDGELPRQLSELRVLDPACGSGHFLAGAFDLLVPLYREEARDRGVELSEEEIADSIIRHNLHGVDIDPRAVQIAAAVLFLKARRLAPRAPIPPMNLVAATFDLDGLAPAERSLVGVRGSLTRLQPLADDDAAAAREQIVAGQGGAGDLGVRFDGAQLPAGLRLRHMLVEGRYDVVVFNPPYLAVSKIDLPGDALTEAFGDSPDLVAAFVERALELCKPNGLIAFVALSNWMFLGSFRATRARVLAGHLHLVADLGRGAFRHASALIQTAMVVASPRPQPGRPSLGARIASRDTGSPRQTAELAAALAREERYERFDPGVFASVEGAPLLFWLDPGPLARYAALSKVGDVAACQGGIATGDNERFVRAIWEVPHTVACAAATGGDGALVPYLKGADGRAWMEPYRWLVRAGRGGVELGLSAPAARPQRASSLGVAYTTIGDRFGARLHTVTSVRDVSGASVFAGPTVDADALVCALNRTTVRELASALNPTVNFQAGDVRRLPFEPVEGAREIVAALRMAFEEHERANELSIDYQAPGPSAWEAAQQWAQAAVDRPAGLPLSPPSFDREPPSAWAIVSHALGVALGRFDSRGGVATSPMGLPDGILWLGPSAPALDHDACALLREAWRHHGAELGGEADLGAYLRKRFFALHQRDYDARPIHLPLSSARRSYVAFVCIHRWASDTLSVLRAEHVMPEKRRLEGELIDLRDARRAGEKGASGRRIAEVEGLLAELEEFLSAVTEVAERGPPPPDGNAARREVDARFVLDLDDGVRVNSAALWPLLDPQWKEPKKWWKAIASGAGRREQDWSQVAARYFPSRVRERCRADASLAAAHRCLWALHPATAHAWEVRLGRERGAAFTIDEPGADLARSRVRAEGQGSLFVERSGAGSLGGGHDD
ncbi:MAG: SAM-dependent methyltransferase [Polyangiaceae bacterium]|nr:SAM-dependent methyltransferase [Polyangiaceae bacterium]